MSNGKSVDVTARTEQGNLIMVEVTAHQSNLVDNIIKDAHAHPKVERIYILCFSEPEARQATLTINNTTALDAVRNKLHVITISKMLSDLNDKRLQVPDQGMLL